MPAVSIIVPTYNRRETILRCLESIRRQSFEDWELLVVDDGSVDGTAELIEGFDPRLRVIRQENQGITGARNTGLRESMGDFLAFLDSDDEWLPHHLALSVGYLRAHPDRAFVSAEFWEVFGPERTDNHYRVEVSEWYPELARRVGEGGMALPPGEVDDYLRVYSTREPVGAWGRRLVAEAGHPDARLYRGRIFDHWRWGYLMAMQPTVLTRAALERIGPFDRRYSNTSDHGFIAALCRHYEASFLSLPTAIKHEYGVDGALPSEEHLATGSGHRVVAAADMLRWCEELHFNEDPDDAQLRKIHAYRRFWLARMLTLARRPDEARAHLEGVLDVFPSLWEARLLSACLRLGPGANGPARLEGLTSRVAYRLAAMASRLGGVATPSASRT